MVKKAYLYSRYKRNLSKTIILTGADSSHFETLVQLLENVELFFRGSNMPELIVWNLGLNSAELDRLKTEYSSICTIRTFNYDSYPAWFDIKENAGEYAWKPNLILESLTKTNKKYLLWLDSGDLLVDWLELSGVFDLLNKRLIYSPIVDGTIAKWTHPGMFEYMNAYTWTPNPIHMRNRNGAIMGFNIKSILVRSFIEEYAQYACIKDCIAPIGSSRLNHRQDQSLFSLLYYRFMAINKIPDLLPNSEIQLGITIHNDVE